MQSKFNGRNWFKWNCFLAYFLSIASNLRPSLALTTKSGNIYFVCGNSTLNAASGSLLSSNFPDFYNNQEDCVTCISVARAFLIEITFEVFQTESLSDLNLKNDMCISDFIEIVAGDKSTKICGNWMGKERLLYFVFITSLISIRFHSNEQNSKLGFVLKWSSIAAHGTESLEPCANALLETATLCYEMIAQPEDWLSGHETCRRRGGYLAKIEDNETQNEIEARLNNSKLRFHAVWIGAHDRLFEGDYMWTDRSAIHFQNWFPGWQQFADNDTRASRQPSDDGYSDEDCVEIRTLFSYAGKGTGQTQSFFWNDRNCNEKNPYICQHYKYRSKRSSDQVPLHCDNVLQLDEARPSVIITSPGYHNNYPALASCHTIVTAPIGKQIWIDFLHFDIEDGKRCEYDNFSVSDLPTSRNNGSVTQCGDWNRKLKLLRWTSETNRIVISFQSDNTKQFSGFSVNVSLVDLGSLCYENNSSATNIYGPGGCWELVDDLRNFTEADEVCGSNGAVLASGEPLNINFAAEMLNVSDGCKTVWVNSGDQTTSLSNIHARSVCDAVRVCDSQRYQGNILLEYSSVITHISCSSLNYALCQKPLGPNEPNRSTQNITSESGIIDVYNKDGQNYDNNQIMSLYFQAEKGFRIIFELVAFDIEYQDQCLYDFIETHGMTVDRRYCGRNTESVTFVSESNSAVLKLTTDEDITGAGFNLSWYWIKNGDAFKIQTDEENLSIVFSVNYPEAFPDTIDNCSSISVPLNYRSYVEIVEVNLPGTNCDDSKLEIISDSGVARVICGGTSMETLTHFSRYILTKGDLKFCLKTPQLQKGEGISMQLRAIPGNMTTLRDTVTLLPNQSINVSSLMFPAAFPDETMHEVIFRTTVGYVITLALNLTVDPRSMCSEDSLGINDISLKFDTDTVKWYSCTHMINGTGNSTQIEFTSALNAVQMLVTSGNHTPDISTFKFSGIVSSFEDPAYLNKTRKTVGTFDECDNTTCKNGGNCSVRTEERFMCVCPPQYTGLFCQASVCASDTNQCNRRHSTCLLTKSGFMCECEPGYYGTRCSMNTIICRYKQCSGNGQCVSLNQTRIGCHCDEFYTGPTCETSVPHREEDLTIGEKLLKEPIWIGMIVIVNLVLFFCVSYVIRRKCGKRIDKLFPECTKTASSSSKENSKGEPSTSTPDFSEKHLDRNINTLTLNIPSTSAGTRWTTRGKSEREDRSSISAPSTPTVTEDNQEAAMKLFAAYNTRKPDLSPNITSIQSARNNLTIKSRDIMSCGIQGGTVTLNPDIEIENQTRDPVHGILRSYTISTEIRDFESRISKAKNGAIRKTSSYAGSPTLIRNNSAEYISNSSKPKVTHCFPEIRIINEHNCEEKEISDSEGTSYVDKEFPMSNESSISKPVAEIAGEVKATDHHDSGYPSTTISTTHDGSQIEEKSVKHKVTASDRRKLFTSKAKSAASFYKIGKENGSIPQGNRKDKRDMASCSCAFKTSSSIEFQSFDSDVCLSCKREKIKRCAYSYDTDLDKIHKCRDRSRCETMNSISYLRHHKRHKRRRKCVDDHINSDIRKPHLHLRREQYIPPCVHQSKESSELRRFRHGGRHFNSSTESDSCLCSMHEMRHHCRHHIREAFSEHDCRRRHGTVQGFEHYPRIDIRSDDSGKSRLMRSFLSDTYRRNVHTFSGPETTDDYHSKNYLCSEQNSSMSSSREKSRSPSPGRSNPLHTPHTLHKKRSDTVVDIADGNFLNFDDRTGSSSNSDCQKIPHNSPSSVVEHSVTKIPHNETGNPSFNGSLDINKEFDFTVTATTDLSSEFLQLPDVECVPIDTYSDLKFLQRVEPQNAVIEIETKPISIISNDVTVLKDSAYQTKQSSIDKIKRDASLKETGVMKAKRTTNQQDVFTRNEDKVHRHLHQAALKLALLKRVQAKKSFSKDSAIHTFSEDDLSTDDSENRGSFRPLVKRSSGSLAFQMRDTILSKVQEEHSGVSRETENYNTPTEEPLCTSFDRSSTEIINSAIPMTDISIPSNDDTNASLEETVV